MSEESKNDVVKEARELLANAAQGPLELIRYDHGGGRLYREEPRDLIADFYDAGNREFYSRAREIVSALCDEVEELRRETLKGMCSYCGLVQHYESLEQKDGAEGNQIRIEHIKQCPQRPELKLIAEVERLMALNNTQAQSIETFQSQLRVMKEAIEGLISAAEFALSTPGFVRGRDQLKNVIGSARSAITPKGESQKV